MEALYSLGLEIHTVVVILLLGTIGFNLIVLALSREVVRYSRRMRIAMPLSISFLSGAIFTGAIMMAAKHLHFSLENISMIVVSVMIAIIEIKRYTLLKYRTDIGLDNGFSEYKTKVFPMLWGELLLTLMLFGWMF